MNNYLLVVDPFRPDLFEYLLNGNADEHYYILWFEKPPGKHPEICKKYTNVSLVYWLNYYTAHSLLKTLKPLKIVLIEIMDFRQIALIMAANHYKINSFFIDHGNADKQLAIEIDKNATFNKVRLPYYIKRFKIGFINILKAKYFYLSAVTYVNSLRSLAAFVGLPFKNIINTPVITLSKTVFRERLPTKALLFNRFNFDTYNFYTGAKKDDAIFTGFPFFDSYFRNNYTEKDYIVYIDHPYLESNYVGWNLVHHKHVAETLFRYAELLDQKIYIKLHPHSNLLLWQSYSYNPKYITILQQGDFTDLYLNSKLIMGFSSALLIGFLSAKKNVVLLGWHPTPQIFGINFSEYNICHVSLDHNDIEPKLNYWLQNNLTSNYEAYNKFLTIFNHPFDGKAAERILEIIKYQEF